MLPTLYEFYAPGGMVSGLSEKFNSFTLNNKTITILGGSMHYFRVPKEYWRDRLRKVRSSGLNTIETYIPWNLHEPYNGIFDFGNGTSELRDLLDIEQFFRTVQEEDLLAIARIGPYICSELDFGGMPSWLLRIPNIAVRSSDGTFLYYFKRFFSALMSVLIALQFSSGGPIIGFQIENEYLQFAQKGIDYEYLTSLAHILLNSGVSEMIFLADDPTEGNLQPYIRKVLYVGSFGEDVKPKLILLKSYLKGRPCMVMEYWTGWYDVWLRNRRQVNDRNQLVKDLNHMFNSYSSFNLYMFVGGTTFGFLNGATFGHCDISPITNSYDFAAPINEAGDYTWKYFVIKEIVQKHVERCTTAPEMPVLKQKLAYKPIPIKAEIRLVNLLAMQQSFYFKNLIPMEYLPINNNSGQSYGYIVYRKTRLQISQGSELKIHGPARDLAMILINGKLISKPLISEVDTYSLGYWRAVNASFTIDYTYTNATLDIIVANLGRASYGDAKIFQNQNKGLLQGSVFINNVPLLHWEIIPMEFKSSWVNNLNGWKKPTLSKGPALYKAVLTLNEPSDTFMDMSSWHMGIVIVNGFVLSRYLRLGPTQTAFLPAPFLRRGYNEIIIFEHFTPYKFITFLGEQTRKRHEPFDIPVYSKNSGLHFVIHSMLKVVFSLSLLM